MRSCGGVVGAPVTSDGATGACTVCAASAATHSGQVASIHTVQPDCLASRIATLCGWGNSTTAPPGQGAAPCPSHSIVVTTLARMGKVLVSQRVR